MTPVEKWQVEVEDAPFMAVEVHAAGFGEQQRLEFLTQFDDFVMADSAHSIQVIMNSKPANYHFVSWCARGLKRG